MLTKLRSTGMKMKAMKPRKRAKELIPFFFFFFCCKPFVASFQMAYREPRATQATQRSRPAKRDCGEEGDKFERNLKKIGNRNLTCKLYT